MKAYGTARAILQRTEKNHLIYSRYYDHLRRQLEINDYGDNHEALCAVLYLLEQTCEMLDELRMAAKEALK